MLSKSEGITLSENLVYIEVSFRLFFQKILLLVFFDLQTLLETVLSFIVVSSVFLHRPTF